MDFITMIVYNMIIAGGTGLLITDSSGDGLWYSGYDMQNSDSATQFLYPNQTLLYVLLILDSCSYQEDSLIQGSKADFCRL